MSIEASQWNEMPIKINKKKEIIVVISTDALFNLFDTKTVYALNRVWYHTLDLRISQETSNPWLSSKNTHRNWPNMCCPHTQSLNSMFPSPLNHNTLTSLTPLPLAWHRHLFAVTKTQVFPTSRQVRSCMWRTLASISKEQKKEKNCVFLTDHGMPQYKSLAQNCITPTYF